MCESSNADIRNFFQTLLSQKIACWQLFARDHQIRHKKIKIQIFIFFSALCLARKEFKICHGTSSCTKKIKAASFTACQKANSLNVPF